MLPTLRQRVTNVGQTSLPGWGTAGMWSQQTENICITFVQRRLNVFDVGPTLYKCYANVFRLLGWRAPGFHGHRWIAPGSLTTADVLPSCITLVDNEPPWWTQIRPVNSGSDTPWQVFRLCITFQIDSLVQPLPHESWSTAPTNPGDAVQLNWYPCIQWSPN